MIADGISEEEDTDDDDNIINRAIDKVLMKGKAAAAVGAAANDPLPPLTTGSAPSLTASASKRVNTKRRRSSAVFVRPSFQFPEFDEDDELMTAGGSTAADIYCATASEDESNSRRASFELAIQEADLMFGPIDDGSRPEETAAETTVPELPKLEETKVYQKVRRSSRFFRAGGGGGGPSLSCSGSEEPSGSVFTEVAVLPKKDRRKSRRTFLAISAHPEGQENAGKGSNSGGGTGELTPDQPPKRSPLSPIDNLLTAQPRNA